MSAMGEFLHNLLGGTGPEPGPPYVHHFKMPEPIGELEDGTPVYPPPGPTHTLTTEPPSSSLPGGPQEAR